MNFLKDSVPVILFNPKITFCDFIRRMIIDTYQQCRRDSLPPGLISESLPQRMAADHARDLIIVRRRFNNSERLNSGNWFSFIRMRK